MPVCGRPEGRTHSAERLLHRFPGHAEGRLTKLKSELVNARHLASVARSIDLGRELKLGRAEEHAGGRSKRGLLADALEALLGAAFLDGGLDAARSIADRLILDKQQIDAADATLAEANAKSTLQELLQGRGLPLPEYELVEETGPAHDRTFHVELSLHDSFHTRTSGRTKREAEQAAAQEALQRQDEWLPE